MIRRHLKIFVTLVIFLAVGFGFVLYQKDSTQPIPFTAAQKTLMQIGDRCVGIAENSVADKWAIVAFQQLEIQGNKANVVISCMRDNGYIENPAWLKYAQAIAKSEAQKSNISVNEALTALGRSDMQVFSTDKSRPVYWVKQK
ncbi:MAG: hypothetical protein V4552_06815 [Pseudomonadota bacterium]